MQRHVFFNGVVMQHENTFRIFNGNVKPTQAPIYDMSNNNVNDNDHWFKTEFTSAYHRLNSEFRIPVSLGSKFNSDDAA